MVEKTPIILFCMATLSMLSWAAIPTPFLIPTDTPGFDHIPTPNKTKDLFEIFCTSLDKKCFRGWETAKQVQKHYSHTTLVLLYHELASPSFRNGLLVGAAELAMQEMKRGSLFPYIEHIMKNSQLLSNEATDKMSEVQVKNLLADMANTVAQVDKKLFLDNMKAKSSKASALWKYAIARSVTYSPTYFVNGVDVMVGPKEPTLNEWIALMDGYIFP